MQDHQMKMFKPLVHSKGFSLPELMITVVILGILASIGTVGLFFYSRIWGVRSAAVELAGYLENAQAVAVGNTQSNCILAITGTGDALQIGPTNDLNNACANLAEARLLPSSPVPLNMNPPTVTNFTILRRGILESTITTRLSAPNTGGREYCVQLLAPSAMAAIGVWQGGSCNHAAFT
jgi:prepilin-type N-terminal cleavage/methylation domain-containing protein